MHPGHLCPNFHENEQFVEELDRYWCWDPCSTGWMHLPQTNGDSSAAHERRLFGANTHLVVFLVWEQFLHAARSCYLSFNMWSQFDWHALRGFFRWTDTILFSLWKTKITEKCNILWMRVNYRKCMNFIWNASILCSTIHGKMNSHLHFLIVWIKIHVDLGNAYEQSRELSDSPVYLIKIRPCQLPKFFSRISVPYDGLWIVRTFQ